MQSGRVFAQWVTYTSHVIWDCCVCGVISHSGDRAFYAWSCRLRLLCLWCRISFRWSSVYTHGHVIWDCCVCGVISHSGYRAFIHMVMLFETVVFVVSYLILAIERLYAWSCCLRLLCLWCHISFWRSSVYTHSHVVWDCCFSGVTSHSGDRAFIRMIMSFETVVFVVSYLILAIEHLYARSCHLRLLYLWCHMSFRWWGILYETFFVVLHLILAIVLQQVMLLEMLYFVLHFECHNNL